jgi:transcriptional regulator with XRE-family HTH domain
MDETRLQVTNPAPNLAKALGHRVRVLRTGKGWSQLRLAELAVESGLREWRRPLIANLEAGHRRLDLGEAIVLASVFGVPLLDLLPAERLLLTEHRAMSPQQVRWYLSGGLDGKEDRTRDLELDADYLAWFLGRSTEREEAAAKAARALGISRSEIDSLAQALWGTSLPAERDRRLAEMPDAEELSARSRQARRGHITRALLSELRQHMATKRPRRARKASPR